MKPESDAPGESDGEGRGAADLSSLQAFAPANPTDNRELYQFQSRWPLEARKSQRAEGLYLALLGVVATATMFALLLYTSVAATPQTVPCMFVVFCTGMLGGTTFTLKWWYHSIARGIWHLDRRAWRITVPWQGAMVAMFMHVLFKSDLVGVLNPSALDKIHNVIAFGFVVGYFSDSAIAKLAEVADSLFGTTRSGREKRL